PAGARWLIGISVVSWAARTESRKDAGSVITGSIGATEDAARRRFAAAAPATSAQPQPLAAARPARDADRPSRMEGDERGFRVALIADELVNPPEGGIDGLALLEEQDWGAIQLPSAEYEPAVAGPLLEQVAEQADEFARHGYVL